MAAAQILAIGDTLASSADVVVAAGAKLSVALKDAAGPKVAGGAQVLIFLKDDAGQYFQVGGLDSGTPLVFLEGPGTYRLTRTAGVSCGVFSG
jgi:hypothetical protein